LSLGAQSLDAALLKIAMEDIKSGGASAAASKTLVRGMLTYLATPAFSARVKGAGFKFANKEKMQRRGIPQSNTGVDGGACAFKDGLLVYFKADLAAQFPALWPAAEKSVTANVEAMCATN
jgi:hypothetical protein